MHERKLQAGKPTKNEKEDFDQFFFCDQCDYTAKNDRAVRKKHQTFQIDELEDPVTSDRTEVVEIKLMTSPAYAVQHQKS